MGDVAMTVPVIRALVLQHPEVKITVVSRPFFKPFFDGISNVNFFAIDLKERHKGFFGLLRLYKDLAPLKIDAVADLHNVLRSKIIRNLFALSGKKTAFVDKGRAEKKALTRAENKIFKPVTSMFERHTKVFKQLGFEINLDNPEFPAMANLSSEILKVTGEKSGKWIGIAPFAQYDSKVYPKDLMQEVIDKLAENADNKIFLFGGGDKEIEILNQLAQGKENVINIAGKLKFDAELKLISNLDVMLSMDSGNSHIGAMLGIKVVTLWGATHPYAGFLCFNQPMDSALAADREKYPLLPTSVYGNKKVAGYDDAMRSIAAESVVQKIEEYLKK
ncbi:glycosyltransferase family 9 protein [Flavobacterium macacae]|uniref:Glycosyltransferase family 9 protein n=2 Tax=Flavobacterium macacae TaxID=2488993 RepID=A0A3P3WLZ0_9FLAO|nr:glycosyltransferase family 9 protein [Flavobacterium macacae]